MKPLFLLFGVLMTLLTINVANALTINPGVNIETTNSTFTITNQINPDNLSIGEDWFVLGADNISFIPNNQLNTNINSWTESSNSFTSEGTGQTVIYNIDNAGRAGVIVYNETFDLSPITISEELNWQYLLLGVTKFRFLDQDDESIVNNETITLELIGETVSYSFSTTDGTINQSLLEGSYNARYSSDNYRIRNYYLSIIGDQSYDFYMINKTVYDNVTITVVNQLGETVSDATVNALKYDLSSNSYLLQESAVTGDSGDVYMSLTLNDEYYKFMVVYDGETVLTTSPDYIRENSLELNIIIGEVVGLDYDRWQEIDHNLSFNDDTNTFRLNWNNLASGVSNICLDVYKPSGITYPIISSQCSTSSAGTLLYSVSPVNGSTYVAKSTFINDAGKSFLLASLTKSYSEHMSAGNLGLFLQIIITGVMIAIGFWSLPVSAILAPLSLIIGKAIGLTAFPLEILIPLQIAGIIIAILVGRRGS